LDVTNEDNDMNLSNFELFVDWLIGKTNIKELANHITSLVVAGNLIKINEGINLG